MRKCNSEELQDYNSIFATIERDDNRRWPEKSDTSINKDIWQSFKEIDQASTDKATLDDTTTAHRKPMNNEDISIIVTNHLNSWLIPTSSQTHPKLINLNLIAALAELRAPFIFSVNRPDFPTFETELPTPPTTRS